MDLEQDVDKALWQDVDKALWQDVDLGQELPIDQPPYPLEQLHPEIYDMLLCPKECRRRLKRNKVRGRYQLLSDIRTHGNNLVSSTNVSRIGNQLFNHSGWKTLANCIFVNAFYRRLLRAKLESTYLDKELPAGLIILGYDHATIDEAIVGSLRVFRIICHYLNIANTYTFAKFSADKLYQPRLWHDISTKCITYFGEDRIEPIDHCSMETNGEKAMAQARVLAFLKMIFYIWSGSELKMVDDMIYVLPASYITHLLPEMKDLYS